MIKTRQFLLCNNIKHTVSGIIFLGDFLIILFSLRKSKFEKEIIEILKNYGADHISDKNISIKNNTITVISVYKNLEINFKNAVVIYTEKAIRFSKQIFPIGTIGVCDECNKNALESFKKSNNVVITCGNNNKNTVTISSITKENVMVTLQRTLIGIDGNIIEPGEFKISLTKNYSAYAIMSATIALLLSGITPIKF